MFSNGQMDLSESTVQRAHVIWAGRHEPPVNSEFIHVFSELAIQHV